MLIGHKASGFNLDQMKMHLVEYREREDRWHFHPLLPTAGQTVTPQVWLTVTTSKQVSRKENPCSSARLHRCVSAADTVGFTSLRFVTPRSSETPKSEGRKEGGRPGDFLHFSWVTLSHRVLKDNSQTTGSDFIHKYSLDLHHFSLIIFESNL